MILSDALKIKDYDLLLYCDFKKHLIGELKKMGFDAIKFVSLLKEYNSYISGSFILKLLVGSDWDIGDIDIYVDSISNYERLICELCNNNFFKAQVTYGPKQIKKFSYNRCIHTYHNKKYKNDRFYQFIVHNFVSNGGIKVQIILVQNDDTITMIDNFFDLNFCKNMFSDKLIVLYPETIKQKKCSIKNMGQTCTLGRLTKYAKRGFQISGINSYYKKNISNEFFKKNKLKDYDMVTYFGNVLIDYDIKIYRYFHCVLRKLHIKNDDNDVTIKYILKKYNCGTNEINGINITKEDILNIIFRLKMQIDNYDEIFLTFQKQVLINVVNNDNIDNELNLFIRQIQGTI
jgi:hypothetical protein